MNGSLGQPARSGGSARFGREDPRAAAQQHSFPRPYGATGGERGAHSGITQRRTPAWTGNVADLNDVRVVEPDGSCSFMSFFLVRQRHRRAVPRTIPLAGTLDWVKTAAGLPIGTAGDVHWWLRQYDGSRQGPVIGDDGVLSWDVDTAAIGESVYIGIGMTADSHYVGIGIGMAADSPTIPPGAGTIRVITDGWSSSTECRRRGNGGPPARW